MEVLELIKIQCTKLKKKKSLDELNRIEIIQERVSELHDRPTEISNFEELKEKKNCKKKTEQNLRPFGYHKKIYHEFT